MVVEIKYQRRKAEEQSERGKKSTLPLWTHHIWIKIRLCAEYQ